MIFLLAVGCDKLEAPEDEPGSAPPAKGCHTLQKELETVVKAAPRACSSDTDCVLAGPTLLKNEKHKVEFRALVSVAKGNEGPVNAAGKRWRTAGCSGAASSLPALEVRCSEGMCSTSYAF